MPLSLYFKCGPIRILRYSVFTLRLDTTYYIGIAVVLGYLGICEKRMWK